jgi:hypothetical protein
MGMRNVPEAVRAFRARYARRRSRAFAPDTEHQLHRHDTPPDVESARAKSRRHGKVTADRWNQ